MARCIVQVLDEVNVRLVGLDDYTLKKAIDELTFSVKNSRFMEAVRAGRWDGKKRLLRKTGTTYRHLLHKIIPIIIKAGYEIVIDDHRPVYSLDIPEIQNNLFEGYEYKRFKGIMDEHQVDAINAITSNGGGLMLVPTGGGKTVITAGLTQLYYHKGKTLIIVPRTDLVIETRDTIRAMGMTDCGAYFGDLKEPSYVTVSTWQSLAESPELFHEVHNVIVDEVHGVRADVLFKLLTEAGTNVPVRIGMTGTLPTDDLSKYNIIAAIGPIIYKKKASELQSSGFLAKCHIFILKFLDKKRKDYQTETHRHQYYTDEASWMYMNQSRIEYLASLIQEMATGENGGNTLVLVRFRPYGRRLHELLPGSIYLNGDDKGEYRAQVYKDVNRRDNAILICTYGIASTGIDVARIFNLVLIEPGKEGIPVVQSIGRGLRKADDKDFVTVYHVASDAKFSSRHVSEVQRIYNENKYPFEIVEVDY
jgi:superfamily II DNA or RNA helicase